MRIVDTTLVSSTGNLEKMPPESHPEVAFAGRSNVGKSSLLNALVSRKGLFKVSATPGRTRTIVHAEARLDTGGRLYLVDLPGYGYAKVSADAKRAWARFVETYLAERTTLHLVIILVDVRRGPEVEERQLIAFLRTQGVPAALVATKLDRVKRSQQAHFLHKLKQQCGIPVLGTSATAGDGVDNLLCTVAQYCGFGGPQRCGSPPVDD